MKNKTVFVHTPAKNPVSSLWEKTFRIGFPTAGSVVYMYNADYGPFGTQENHYEWINRVVSVSGEYDELIFCDPDVIFYDNIEELLVDHGQLMSGRYCPQFANEVFKAIEVPRLHTSLLYIPNPVRLRAALNANSFGLRRRFQQDNWWQPHLVVLNRVHHWFDTGASIYQAVGGEHFDDQLLDRYTHLNCGTMLEAVAPLMKRGDDLREIHSLAFSNPLALKGLWKKQNKYYSERQTYGDCVHTN
jgi:hypothetical protein